jgi:AmiR/NasT family two-component response regulator
MAKAKILIVEDEAITAKDLQNMLKELGYDVPAIASSGEGAIKTAEEIEPDVVLMDIVLKGDVDGIEAAELIRVRFDIPVVYVTAYLDEGRLEKTKVTEPYGYIIKPFGNKELRPVIEMALQRYRLEKALRESEAKYRTFIEMTSEGYWVLDSEHKTGEVNQTLCDLLGYTRAEKMSLLGLTRPQLEMTRETSKGLMHWLLTSPNASMRSRNLKQVESVYKQY